jgi:hypothetical protein
MNLEKIDSERLIQELQNRGYIRVLWHRDDVVSTAEEMNITLNDDEISFVMDEIEADHDANYGVNWDFIQIKINDVISNRENKIE